MSCIVQLSCLALAVRLVNLYTKAKQSGEVLSLFRDHGLSPPWGLCECSLSRMLVSGVRYLFSSGTVPAHRKFQRFFVPVSLHLIERTRHYQYFGNPAVDKLQDVFPEMTIFYMRI